MIVKRRFFHLFLKLSGIDPGGRELQPNGHAREETWSGMGGGKGEWSEHGERMEGTVLIRWEKGYEEKLVVVTDLDEAEPIDNRRF